MQALQVDLAVLDLLLQKHRRVGVGTRSLIRVWGSGNFNLIGVWGFETALIPESSSREHAHLLQLGLTSSSYGTQMLLQGC